MAIRIDLDKRILQTSLEQSIASLKRARDSKHKAEPEFIELYNKQIAIITTAVNTMTDVK